MDLMEERVNHEWIEILIGGLLKAISERNTMREAFIRDLLESDGVTLIEGDYGITWFKE